MAIKDNKGFSLIEVVIAIALFSLLLSPIIKQFTQTLQTNRQVKEQQYANDNAEEVLEYFQKVDLNKAGLDDLDVLSSYSVDKYTDTTAIDCEIFLKDGTSIGTVQYNAYKYTLDNVELGTRSTEYLRTVYVDDLANKLAAFDSSETDLVEEGYEVRYDLKSDDVAGALSGFKYVKDGSLVTYNADGFITSAVCEKRDYNVVDPNTINLGNMQNLDYNTVALIQGNATNFDKQAEDAFYALKMKNLKENNFDSWDQAMNHDEGVNIFTSQRFISTTKKLSLVTTTKNADDTYTITCDVYYEDTYTLPKGLKEGGGTVEFTDKLTYNVFSQTFNMDKCPDIYFIYQPFTRYRTLASEEVYYNESDYILVNSNVEDVKMYLLKPNSDEQYSVISDIDKEDNDTIYEEGDNTGLVNICLNYVKDTEPVDIFTNIIPYVSDINGNLVKEPFNDNGNSQFKFASYLNVQSAGFVALRNAYDKDYVHFIEEDTRYDDVLQRVTVELKRVDGTGNVIKLTGAKGDN